MGKAADVFAQKGSEGSASVMFETERLVLRRWEDSDAADLYEYARDPDVGPIAGWPPHRSVAESREVIRSVFSGKEAYAICLKDGGRPIGAIELKLNGHTDMTGRDDECELGYWLGKPFWGRGIMPEAVREMLRRAFEELGMTRVWAGYYEGNDKSRRVQEKCGFRHRWKSEDVDVPLMHEKRTGHVSSLTREQWQRDRLRCAAPAGSPVILLNGPSSSGKSTLAGALRASLRAQRNEIFEVVSIDDFMKTDPNEPIYEDDVWEISGGMCERALEILRTGRGVIIDHVITSERIFRQLKETLRGYPLRPVRVTCPLEVLRKREEARGDRCRGSAEASDTYLYPKDGYDLTVDTGAHSPEECAAVLMERLF